MSRPGEFFGIPFGGAAPLDLSVVVPTRNEAANVTALVEQLENAIGVVRDWEILIVDDSDDATLEILKHLCEVHGRLRVIHRPPSDRAGGLSGAVLVGFAAASGRVLLVMDGDLQHPPIAAAHLAELVCGGAADVAIGSRYVPGGSALGLASPYRRFVSRTAALVTRLVFTDSRLVRDPLAGFFAIRRGVVDGIDMDPDGFKILLEILTRGHWNRLVELPVEFAERQGGVSKANLSEGMRFIRHAAALRRPTRAEISRRSFSGGRQSVQAG